MKIAAAESSNTPEFITLAAETVRQGLLNAYNVHESLGEDGVSAVEQNQFGETALVADVQAERALIDALQALQIHVSIRSEEHGNLELHPEISGQHFLAVMDGLDGSSLYKKERGVGRYGTMFAIFGNSSPTYQDYLAAGIMEHSTKRLILAVSGKGLSVTNVETGVVTHGHTNTSPVLAQYDNNIFVDDATVKPGDSLFEYFSGNRRVFGEPLRAHGYHTARTGSSAAYYAALATGEAQLVGEATRKGNLEFASAYALVKEAGGVMLALTKSGQQDLGQQLFTEFGQTSHIPILSAANQAVADQALKIL